MTYRTRRQSPTLGLCLLGSAGAALLAAPAQASEGEENQIIVTGVLNDTMNTNSYRSGYSSMGNKNDVPALEQAQTVDVVTPRVIQDQAPQTLDDIAKFVPGLNVGNSFGGARDTIMTRGFGKDEENGVLRDGVRQITGRNFQPVTTERVEVLKGPAGLLYSMNEPGGVINIVTKKPRYELGANVGGTLYSPGGGDVWGDITGPIGHSGLAFRLIGQRRDEDYWRDFGHRKQTLISPSLAYKAGDLSAVLSYQYVKAQNTIDRSAALDSSGNMIGSRDVRMDEAFSEVRDKQQSINFTGEYRLGRETRLRLTVGYAQNEYEDDQVRFGSNVTQTNVPRSYSANRDGRYSTGYQALELISSQSFLGMRHDIIVGVDHERRRRRGAISATGSLSAFNPADPVYAVNIPTAVTWNLGRDYQGTTGYALYAKDNIHIGDRLIVSPGLRWQRYEILAGEEDAAAPAINEKASEILPSLGLLYKIAPTLSLYGSFARSFLAPAIETDDNFAPLEEYKPETGRQYEVGIKFDNGRFSTNLALFDIRKSNVYQKDQTLLIQWLAGRVTSRGIEWSGTGELAKNWNLAASYAYTDATYSRDVDYQGNILPNVPKHVASLYLTRSAIPVAGGLLRAGAGIRYVGKRYIEQNNRLTVSGYTIGDAFLSWSTQRLTGRETVFQLNLNNVTDKAYIVSTGNQARRMTWGEGRTLRFTARTAF